MPCYRENCSVFMPSNQTTHQPNALPGFETISAQDGWISLPLETTNQSMFYRLDTRLE